MNNMEKQQAESIKKNLDFLWNCTRDANGYFHILQQFMENKGKYSAQMGISTAFYHFTFNAYALATFSEISRIYDKNSNTNFFMLIEKCNNNLGLLLKIRVENLKHNKENKKIDQEYLEQRFERLTRTIDELNPLFDNLKSQRDKIYAHNDSKSIDSIENVIKKHPISMQDMKQLVNCTTETLDWIYNVMAQRHLEPLPKNINDWKETLSRVKLE